MHNQVSLFAIILLALLGLNIFSKSQQGQNVAKTSQPTPTISDVEIATPSATVPVTTPSPSVQLAVTPKSIMQNNDSDWKYPGSTWVGSMKWESQDPASKITDWYVEKIARMGFSATSVARTNTNNRVLNKITASSNSFKIKIEISQTSDNAPVEIKVVLGD